MKRDLKKYYKISFKLVLLVVYAAFFSVQLFFRYSPSPVQQFIDLDNDQKNPPAKQVRKNVAVAQKDNSKNKNSNYLNKRYHPQDEVVVPGYYFPLQPFYTTVVSVFYTTDSDFTDAQIALSPLRGPPAGA